MERMRLLAWLFWLVVAVVPSLAADDGEEAELPEFLNGLSFSGQWFLAYDIEEENEVTTNEFLLKRGYVTVKKQFTPSLSARITQDISVDQEGDGRGDIEMKLKYGYMRYIVGDFSIFTDNGLEFGLVHRPWLDFEQKINPYRVQGQMFLERFGVLRSADYGVTLAGLFGGEIDNDYQQRVSGAYPGKYGSYAIGVYNGGGYDAIEENQNKLVETRLTFRPLPRTIPGVQVSLIGGFGKGNIQAAPDLVYNSVFLSLEHQHYIGTYLYYTGEGRIDGMAVDSLGNSIDRTGHSVFVNISYPHERLSLFGRFDQGDNETAPGDWTLRRYVAGIAYQFYGKSQLLVDIDYLDWADPEEPSNTTFEFAVEIGY